MVGLQELNRPLTTPAPNAQGALGTWSNQIRLMVQQICTWIVIPGAWGGAGLPSACRCEVVKYCAAV
jgi:hypothetical protein